MRAHAIVGLAVATGLLAACGAGRQRPVEINPQSQPVATRWNATLVTPAGLAGALQIQGTAWMGAAEGDSLRTRAEVQISNAAPGGRHPWHVHRGQCGNDLGILGAPGAYPVLEVGGDGRAQASATLDIRVPSAGQYFVNVHASPANMGTIVACGNLAPPVR